MKNNIYLNEERYKNTKRKIKLVGTMIIIGALCLLGFGVISSIKASSMVVPDMMASNWFEASVTKSNAEFRAHTMIMIGVFLTVVGCIIRFVVGNAREINAYGMQTMIPIAQEGIKTMTPTMVEVQKEMINGMMPVYKDMAREMTPVYGEVAKEISKGIKEGLK